MGRDSSSTWGPSADLVGEFRDTVLIFLLKFVFVFLLVYAVVRYPVEVRAVQEVMLGWFLNLIAPLVNRIYTPIMEINAV